MAKILLVGQQYTSKVSNNYKPWKGGPGKGNWETGAPGLAVQWLRKHKKANDVLGDSLMGSDDMGGAGLEDFTFDAG